MITIVSDPKVRQYELTFLLQAGLTSAEVKKIADSLAELLTKYNLTIDAQQDWGKKDLAYAIKFGAKRQTEALYHHWLLTGPASALPALERELNLLPTLMRYLLVVADGRASATVTNDQVAKEEETQEPAAKKPVTRKKTTSTAKKKADTPVAAKPAKE